MTARRRFWSTVVGTVLCLTGGLALLFAYQDELDADRPDPCGGA